MYLTGYEAAVAFGFAVKELPRAIDKLRTPCNNITVLPGSLNFSMAGDYNKDYRQMRRELAITGGRPIAVNYTFSPTPANARALGFEDLHPAEISPSPEVVSETAMLLGSLATLPLCAAGINAFNRAVIIGDHDNLLGIDPELEAYVGTISNQPDVSKVDDTLALHIPRYTVGGQYYTTVFDPYGSKATAQIAGQNG